MSSELVINVSPTETRVVRLENGTISELYIERAREAGYVGNIYKGKVVRVLPGMQAAFVEIGLERTAFLYVTDIVPELTSFDEVDSGGDDATEEVPVKAQPERRPRRRIPQIQDLLKEGQDVLVQIARDPIGTKGARLTCHISLPGRFMVFMPTVNHLGISRRIADDRERSRLRNFLEKVKPKEGGLIVRTMSEGASFKDLKQDVDYLEKMWQEICAKKDKCPSPSLVHSELGIVLKAIRDLFSEDIDRVVIDSASEGKKVRDFIESFMPRMKQVVEIYDATEPIFDAFGIEIEISRALGKKVWLKSGGYLIIDQTEALTVVDVNTGKFVGKKNLEDTILKTNLEAAREIAYQLRMRDIGGIIIIDFIDMERHTNRDKVYQTLKEVLKPDRAKTTITKITELGLVEMTRKRTRESLSRLLTETCFYCEGRGYLKNKPTVCHEIFRELKRGLPDLKKNRIVVQAHPSIATLLTEEEHPGIEEWEKIAGKKVAIKGKEDYHLEQFDIFEE
ncbi:MAG: Rne/Rng family ribonuclease [Deltaproteobacteria bacterium]|nr:Rne/Rng family ribonuclease [Deltaproteobacteria bacterium]